MSSNLVVFGEVIRKYLSWKVGLVVASGVGIYMIKQRMAGGVCRSRDPLTGKTVIITGANSGIGREAAIDLARRDAKVIIACRTKNVSEKAAKDIRQCTKKGILVVKELDLGSLQSVRDFCTDILKTEPRVDILINNAGIYQCPFAKTEEGHEMQFGVNHLGHFLLTNILLDKLKDSAPSRIIIVSSGLHALAHLDFDNLNAEKGYNKRNAYNVSKLANNLFARELSRRLEKTGVNVYCLSPGMARTNLGRHVPSAKLLKFILWPLAWLLVKSARQGSQTVIYCAVSQEIKNESGKYYADCREKAWSPISLDEELALRMWKVSEKMTGLSD